VIQLARRSAFALLPLLGLGIACSNAESPKFDDCSVSRTAVSGSDTSVHWALVASPTNQRLSAVKITGITTGVAVGDSGTYLIYGGGNSWTTENVGPTQHVKNFYGVEATPAGEVWIVGDSGLILHAPTLLGGWSQETSNVSVTLFAIWRVGTDLYAVGDGGVIIHSSGSGTWTALASPTSDSLFATSGLSDSIVFAAGAGGIGAQYNGTSWTSDQTGASKDLRAIGIIGDSVVRNAWAVGDGGLILHSTSGATGTWTVQASGTAQSLFGIAVDSAGRAVTVGGGGTILHANGGAWNTMSGPTHADLRAVATGRSAAGEYWAVGTCGAILHGTTP